MLPRRLSITLIAISACAGLSFVAWPLAFTVVPIAQVEALALSETFDPVAYVDGVWATQIQPTVVEQAVDLALILNALAPDADGLVAKAALIAVAEQHGRITVGEAHVYMVKANGLVTAIDTSKSLGTLQLQVDGYAGPIEVVVYIGPRIPSDESSVRDAVGFINFGDFKDQTEYGKVSAEINRRVSAEVLAGFDSANLVGKPIALSGAFTLRTFNLLTIDVSQVKIVPVLVTVQ